MIPLSNEEAVRRASKIAQSTKRLLADRYSIAADVSARAFDCGTKIGYGAMAGEEKIAIAHLGETTAENLAILFADYFRSKGAVLTGSNNGL